MDGTAGFSVVALARTVETMSRDEIDALPFGVIRLDDQGLVLFQNETELRQSGFKKRPSLGLSFFADVAPCMNNDHFAGRIEMARAAGTLDISFSFVGDFSDKDRELKVRVQSASDGGIWIFIARSDTAPGL